MSEQLLQMSGIVVDLIYEVDQVPVAGSEAVVSGCRLCAGGGYNALIAAKRAGLAVCYGGPVGRGPFAQLVLNALENEGIAYLQTPGESHDQGCCTVLVDKAGERTFIASDGAQGYVSAEALAPIRFDEFEWTLLSGYALQVA